MFKASKFKSSKQMYSLSRASFSLLLPQRQPPMCALALQKRLQTKVNSTEISWMRMNVMNHFIFVFWGNILIQMSPAIKYCCLCYCPKDNLPCVFSRFKRDYRP